MIYVKNTGEKQIIILPKSHHSESESIYHLRISHVDTAIYEVDLEDLGGSWLYYNFQIDLPKEIVSGEYEYILIAEDGDELSKGIMVVEWDRPDHDEYVKFVEYEQYGEK